MDRRSVGVVSATCLVALCLTALCSLYSVFKQGSTTELEGVSGRAASGVSPEARALAANLATFRNHHSAAYYHVVHRQQLRAPPRSFSSAKFVSVPQRSDAHDVIRARGVSKAAALPAGQLLRMLLPGQKLPPGAVVVRVPQLAQRVSARMAVAAGTMLPDDTTEGVGAQETVVSTEGAVEGTAEGGAEGAAEEVQTPPPPPVNPFDMIRTAMDRKSDALLEQNAARALQKRALILQKAAVELINRGWKKHATAEEELASADEKEKAADEKMVMAAKLTQMANAKKQAEFAEKLKTVAETFNEAAVEKAADAEKWQSMVVAGNETSTTAEVA